MKQTAVIVTDKKNVLNENSRTFEERARELAEIEKREEKARKREKNSPFTRWTQFNNEHTNELIWLAVNHPKAHAILLFLVEQMDIYNAVMCSYQVLQEVLAVSKDTIRINIKVLKDSGFIAVLKSGTSNIYAINHDVYWKSWGDNKKYSKFPANVILSLCEQEKSYQKKLKISKTKEVSLKEA